MRLRQRGARADGPGGRGPRDRRDSRRHGDGGPVHAGRRGHGRHRARLRHHDPAGQRPLGVPDALGGGGRQTAGAADRRDRRARGRLARLRPAPVARGLPGPAGTLSAERGPVRHPRRARLPHPREFGEGRDRGRQRVQRQNEIAAARGLRRSRGPRAPRTAHRRHGTGVRPGGARHGVGADPGPAVARERAGQGDVLRARAGPPP